MRKQRLSDLLFKPKTRWVTNREWLMKPPPIGHHLAIHCFENLIYRETLFADNVTVLPSYTKIIYNKKEHVSEIYPEDVDTIDQDLSSVRVYYKNNTYFEIIRIS